MNSISSCRSQLQNSLANKQILSGIQYPGGVIMKTWARGFPQGLDDISIEQVLQKDDLTMAVLSSYQLNVPWIMTKLSPLTRVYWVLHHQADAVVS